MTRNFVLCLFTVLIMTAFLPAPGHAQEITPARKDSIAREVASDLKNDKDVNILLDKIEILGRVERPQTVFILPGQDPTAGDIQIDRSFFKEIFRSVEKDNIIRKITNYELQIKN